MELTKEKESKMRVKSFLFNISFYFFGTIFSLLLYNWVLKPITINFIESSCKIISCGTRVETFLGVQESRTVTMEVWDSIVLRWENGRSFTPKETNHPVRCAIWLYDPKNKNGEGEQVNLITEQPCSPRGSRLQVRHVFIKKSDPYPHWEGTCEYLKSLECTMWYVAYPDRDP